MIGAVYVVTEAAAPLSILKQARAAAAGGAWAVQLRDKTATDAQMCEMGAALLLELAGTGVKLFINDRVEVACAIAAHGLHIGQSDGDPRAARARIGPDMLLGLSVETIAQAQIVPDCVDYIGVGPVRATDSKPDHATPIGMEGLGAIARMAPCPVIAIGGIGAGDAPALRRAGAVGMAVVSAVTRAPDPEAATRKLVQDWKET